MDGLKAAQWLFLIIPLGIMAFIYTSMAGAPFEPVLENPIVTAQILTVCTYPFCYLFLKSIRAGLEKGEEGQLPLLWALLAGQLLSMNFISALLLAYGIYQEYGKDMIDIHFLKLNRKNRASLLGFLPIILIYGFVLFIKIRVGAIG